MSEDHTERRRKDLRTCLEEVATAAGRIAAALRAADVDEAAQWLGRRQAALSDLAAASAARKASRPLPPDTLRAAQNALRTDEECIAVARSTRDDIVKRLIDSYSGQKVTRAYRARPPGSAQAISTRK